MVSIVLVLKYLRTSDLLFVQRLLIHRPFFGVSLKRNFTALETPALLASERSERDTISGVQIRAGAVYILASERSERDTIRGVQIRAGAVRIYV